jgi:hypothetical protein
MATITQYDDFYFAETVCAKTITAPPTDGAIVVAFTRTTTTVVSSITDNQSGTYTLDHSRVAYNGTTTLDVYRRSNIDNAPTQVTVTFDTSGNYRIFLSVVDGMTAGTATPTVTSQADTAGGTTHAAEFTTVRADDIGFTFWSQSSGETMTPPSGWTVINNTGGTNDGATAVTTGTAGAKSLSYTSGGYTITQFNTLTYPSAATGPTVSSVSNANANEGSSVVHTVTLSGATTGTTNYASSLAGSGAHPAVNGVNFSTSLGSATFSNGVTFSTPNLVVPTSVSSFTVTVPTTDDNLYNYDLTYTLTVGGTTGTGTINNTDTAPTWTVSSPTVAARGDNAVFTLTLNTASGRGTTFVADTRDGTAEAGTDYTARAGITVTIPAGDLTADFTVTTLA